MVFVIPLASSYSFGALTPETSKTTSGNVSFRLGLVNPGDESLNVSFRSEGLENGQVVFPDSFKLEPSRMRSYPGDGWVSISANSYIKPRWVKFYVLTNDTSDRSFRVQAAARRMILTSEQTTSPRTVQVREFKYNLDYTGEKFSDSDDRDQKTEYFSFESDEAGENKSEEQNQYVIFGNKSTEKAEKNSGGIISTAIMMVVASFSVLYLWRAL